MIGILGGGQLGRMLALAARPLGIATRILETAADVPAAPVSELMVGSFEDPEALDAFSAGLSAVTYEFENVPVLAAQYLEQRLPVFPPPRALEVAQDRGAEKHLFQQLGIDTPPFHLVDDEASFRQALDRVGLPGVIKTRRFGYDGKGQAVVRTEAEARDAFLTFGPAGLIWEGFVPFDRELSSIAVRSSTGEVRFYPLVENHHSAGILRKTIAPAPHVPTHIERQAENWAREILEHLNYVGVLAIELFERQGKLLANEIAPRVHNSGHWTMEGAETSQFENHIRAVAGLPLGSTNVLTPTTMLNLIGTLPSPAPLLALPGAHLHLYDKEPRAGRKLGHLNIRQIAGVDLAHTVAQAERLIPIT